MKRLYLLLFSLWSSVSFSAVECVNLGDGLWDCSGTGGSIQYNFHTNLVGTCVNCIQVSEPVCDQIMQQIYGQMSFAESSLYSAQALINESVSELYILASEGNSFTPVQYYSDVNEARSTTQFAYALNFQGLQISNRTVTQNGNPANSIANYYYSSVSGSVATAINSLQSAGELVDGALTSQVAFTEFLLQNVNCSSCPYNIDVNAVIDVPLGSHSVTNNDDGGGTITYTNGQGCAGCPCSEQLNALLRVALGIKQNASDILTSVEKFRIQNHADLLAISNLTHRIDQYVEVDLDRMVHSISNNCMYLAASLSMANQLVNSAGGAIDLEQTSKDVFSESGFNQPAYKNLNWYNRVELLLARLNGVGVDTNTPPSTITDSHVDQVKSSLNSFTNELTHLESTLPRTVFQSINQSVNLFKSQLPHSTPTASSNGIVLMDGGTWIGDEPLILKIDVRVQNYSRVVFILIWSVIALVLFFHVVVKGTMLIWFLIEMINKFFIQMK